MEGILRTQLTSERTLRLHSLHKAYEAKHGSGRISSEIHGWSSGLVASGSSSQDVWATVCPYLHLYTWWGWVIPERRLKFQRPVIYQARLQASTNDCWEPKNKHLDIILQVNALKVQPFLLALHCCCGCLGWKPRITSSSGTWSLSCSDFLPILCHSSLGSVYLG